MSVEKKLAISFITIATIILGMLAILSDTKAEQTPLAIISTRDMP